MEFETLFKEIVDEVTNTRDGNDIYNVERMCEYMYNRMQKIVNNQRIEIYDLKGELIRSKAKEVRL